MDGLKMIQKSEVLDIYSVPEYLKDFLELEDVSDFNTERYFFAKREQELYEHIVNNDLVSEVFEEKGIRYLNATLLYGESGTGKTTLGRYIAHRLNLPFAYINFARIISGEYGGTQKNISDIFGYINGKRCVFMLDEIDCISRRRQSNGELESSENSRVTITLMQELDKFRNVSIVIGATNILSSLDPALLRRFAIRHEVKRLDTIEMEKFIKNYLDTIDVKYDEENIRLYCKQNSRISQAFVQNDILRNLANSIINETSFNMTHIE